MPSVRFYPVGNGDCSQIRLDNGKRLLFDYRQVAGGEQEGHATIDLASTLRAELDRDQRDDYDVVGFSHGDYDHICGASDFFEFEHDRKYQGRGRTKIRDLWVPAQMITDTDPCEEGEILRREARYRLRNGRGIRVFSRPERLRTWLESQGLTVASRAHLISDAGTLVPGFSKVIDQVEFFVHSPFMKHTLLGDVDRNEAALILHATFAVNGRESRYFLIGDSDCDVLSDIVDITVAKGRIERLRWDIYNIPHHCSYRALAPEKGARVTVPCPGVAQLLDYGEERCTLICSSIPVPADYDRKMPPHIQAKNTYDALAAKKRGSVHVTGDSKDRDGNPVAIEIEVTSLGVRRRVAVVATAASLIGAAPARRAGLPRGK